MRLYEPTTEPVAAGVVIDRTKDGIVLRELTPDHVRTIGTFTNAADAWRALDELDLAAQGAPALAQAA